MYYMNEDDLTDAIFNGATLPTSGSGTKAEARTQARAMLAAHHLLAACESVIEALRGPLPVERENVIALLSGAVQLATGKPPK